MSLHRMLSLRGQLLGKLKTHGVDSMYKELVQWWRRDVTAQSLQAVSPTVNPPAPVPASLRVWHFTSLFTGSNPEFTSQSLRYRSRVISSVEAAWSNVRARSSIVQPIIDRLKILAAPDCLYSTSLTASACGVYQGKRVHWWLMLIKEENLSRWSVGNLHCNAKPCQTFNRFGLECSRSAASHWWRRQHHVPPTECALYEGVSTLYHVWLRERSIVRTNEHMKSKVKLCWR